MNSGPSASERPPPIEVEVTWLDVRNYVNGFVLLGLAAFFSALIIAAFITDGDAVVKGAIYFECPNTSQFPCPNPFVPKSNTFDVCRVYDCRPFVLPGESIGRKPSFYFMMVPYLAIGGIILAAAVNHGLWRKRRQK